MDIIEEEKVISEDKKSNILIDWIIPIAIAVILAVLINKFLVCQIEIPSESMMPTLNKGDRLFATKIYNLDNLKCGDIIVFDSQEYNKLLIKRLIGLPGDKISITNGIVYRNGTKLEEDYVINNDEFYGYYEVPEGQYFFLGDNRIDSADSRMWSNPYVKGEDIKLKAQVKIYPFSDIGKVK